MNRIHLALGLALALPAFAALAQETVAPATEKDGVLVDGKGMTLYTYDKDSEGQSACSGQCAKNWPPLAAAQGAQASGDWSLVAREDGTQQWAYYGKPLYTFIQDKKPGDKNGDGKMGAWRRPAGHGLDGRRPARRSTQRVVGDRAEEDRQASPVVVQEGAEAGLRVAVAGRPGFPDEAGRRHRQAEVEAQAQFEAVAGQH